MLKRAVTQNLPSVVITKIVVTMATNETREHVLFCVNGGVKNVVLIVNFNFV